MTKAIAGRLTWMQAAEVLGITPWHMRRIRRGYLRSGISAVMDQRGGRPRRKAGVVKLLIRLKRDVYADFRCDTFTSRSPRRTRSGLQMAAGNPAGSPSGGEGARAWQVSALARTPPDGGHAAIPGRSRPMNGSCGYTRQDLVIALDDADGPILYRRSLAQEGVPSTFAALEGVLRRYSRF